MQAAQWVDVLGRVPLEAQNALLLGMTNGSEISVQDLLRIDENFVLLRGRVGGTTDGGRLFCIPYHQITYCCITRFLPSELVAHIFGAMLQVLEEDAPLRDDASPQPGETGVTEPAKPEAPQATTAPMRVEPAAPSAMRERLRARLATSDGRVR